jgi:hypothetical protein
MDLKLFSKEEFEPIHQTDFVSSHCYEYRFNDKCCNSWGDMAAFGRDILLQATDLNIGLFGVFQWVFTEL